MAVFKKRPLAVACFSLILSVAASYPLSVKVGVLITALLAILLLLAVILCTKRGMGYRRLLLVLTIGGILLGTGRALSEKIYAESLTGKHVGQTEEMTLVIEDIEAQNAYGSRLLVKITEIGGDSCSVKALLVIDEASPFYMGDRIKGHFTCVPLEEHSLYRGQEMQYRADRILVALVPSSKAPVSFIKSGIHSLRTRLSDWRGLLHYRLTAAIGGEEGELVSAMLLGTKEALDNGTTLQFRRVGLSHLLALSGLHLAILAGELELFLRVCRVGKRSRLVLLLGCLLFYWFLTGCSFSMLRAVLMFAVLQLAFFTKGDYDALTALFLVGGSIVLVTPGAVVDLSFQMTMLATLGILSFSELHGLLLHAMPRRKGAKGLVTVAWRTLLSSLFMTLTATLTVLPVQWLTFGEISLLTPLANPIMIPLATLLLWLALPLLPICFLPTIATVIGTPIWGIAHVMLRVTGALAPMRGMISLRHDFVPFILLPLLIATAILLAVDLKRLRFLCLAPAGVAALAFAAALVVTAHTAKGVDVIYRTTGANDGVLLVQNGRAVICDVSNGSATQFYDGYKVLQEHCATEVEVLMLTHYHDRQPTALARFADFAVIRQLWLPTPQREADIEAFASILEIAADEGIDVTVYGYDTPLTVFGEGSVTVSSPLYASRSTEAALMLHVSYGQGGVTYQSAAYSEYARHLSENGEEITTDYLILGGHGPNPHESILPHLTRPPREVVLSDEDALLHLEPSLDCAYVLLPQKIIYRLE